MPDAPPEMEDKKEKRRVGARQAGSIDIHDSRHIGQLKMKRFVLAQIDAAGRANPDREPHQNDDQGNEISVTIEPALDPDPSAGQRPLHVPFNRHGFVGGSAQDPSWSTPFDQVTGAGRPRQRSQAPVARISSIVSNARSSSSSVV